MLGNSLVEERLHLTVLEQRRHRRLVPGGGERLCKVADARRDRQLLRTIRQHARWLQPPARRVPVLSLARMHVEVEVTHQHVIGSVPAETLPLLSATFPVSVSSLALSN